MIKQPINLPEGFELEDFPARDLIRLAKLFRSGVKFNGDKVVVFHVEIEPEALPELDKSEGPGE